MDFRGEGVPIKFLGTEQLIDLTFMRTGVLWDRRGCAQTKLAPRIEVCVSRGANTGWHADRPAHKAPTAIVPGLSLGAPRRFLVRRVGGGPSTVFTPAGGDLIIMKGRCQRDWQHCVPKQKALAGPRMSLNFSTVTQS